MTRQRTGAPPARRSGGRHREERRPRLGRARRIGALIASLAIAFGLFGPAAASEPIQTHDQPTTNQGTPTLTAQVSSGFMYGNDWPAGATVEASVNGTITGSATADSRGFVSFPGNAVIFGAGDTIELTDGTTTKTLVVSPIDLDVIDPAGDVIAGTSAPGDIVEVSLNDGAQFCLHEIAVEASGTWSVDFSQPDPWGRICDLGYEDPVFASVTDEDGDRTQLYVQYPRIQVNRFDRTIQGLGWFEGGSVDITHDGTTVGAGVTIDRRGGFWISIAGPIAVGDVVSVTDGTYTKSLVVADITATPYDPDAMTMEGTAPPGETVFASISGRDGFCSTEVVAGAAGDWLADFSTVTPNVGTCDLGPLASAWAYLLDDDADETWVTPRLPRLTAQRYDGTVYGSDWEPGIVVDLLIEGSPAGSGTTNDRGFVLISPTLDFTPGDSIELTDGTTTKSLVVSAVDADTIDPETDVVSGTASPGETVQVQLFRPSASCYHEVPINESGTWSVDFSQPDRFGRVCDLGYGDGVDVSVTDDDGDRTILWVITPTLRVDDTFDTLWGFGWFSGDPVDIERNGATVVTGVAVDNGFFWLDLDSVSAGDVIMVTDGTITKSVTVADLTVGFYEPSTETVYGSASPGTSLSVNVSDGQQGSCTVTTTADANGAWTADFSDAVPEHGSCDFGSDAFARAYVTDEDGDQSQVTGTIPRILAYLDGRLGESRIRGTYWQPDALVDISVNGVRVASVTGDQFLSFETTVPTLGAGDEIVATDGTVTKTLVVVSLRVADVDHETDVVSGIGPPLETVDIRYFDKHNGCLRAIAVGSHGQWSVDFSTATSADPACDLGTSAAGRVWHGDEDGDQTTHSLDPSEEPTATDDDYQTPFNTTLEIAAPGVLGNDTDPNGDHLNVYAHDSTSTEGGNVTVSADGSFTYEPPLGFAGTDTFDYTVTDGTWGDTGTVTVEVTSASGGGGSTPPPGGGDDTALSPPRKVCPEITGPGPFSDLDGMSDKAKTAISCLRAFGITQGTSATEFSPGDPVPRWQMALFLGRLAELHGMELPSGEDQMFVDIADLSSEAQQAINQLAGLGVTQGTEAFVFDPASNVPRWQMALFLIRLIDATGVELDDSPPSAFLDLEGLTPTQQTAISQLAEFGITTGTGPTTFDPFAEVPRWQMALFLARVIEVIGITPE